MSVRNKNGVNEGEMIIYLTENYLKKTRGEGREGDLNFHCGNTQMDEYTGEHQCKIRTCRLFSHEVLPQKDDGSSGVGNRILLLRILTSSYSDHAVF